MTLKEKLFDDHHNYYKSLGIETIQQQAGQVEQVTSDYQGRVIYELLQNAFDKANKQILIQVIGDILYVANDGIKFNYASEYDYFKNTTERGDFQSLCSISTSTKNASTSIGNKGVGFKSAFSIASGGFVNVHTQGEVIFEKRIKDVETISFRIYDTFKNVESIPVDFSNEVKQNLTEKIKLIQNEFKERGIPGFYFPLQIKSNKDYINQLFENGYVTIIEIPLYNKQDIKGLFDEIQNIHFQFIRLKYPNYPDDFVVKLLFDEVVHNEYIKENGNAFYSTEINSDKLILLAHDAGISIKKSEIAIFINENSNGLLYNYLPTQIKSPFKFIDFHADFHTTVDRKSINFDGKIGLYNKALLRACLELFFEVVNSFIYIDVKVDLELEYVRKKENGYKLTNFSWEMFALNKSVNVFSEIRQILKISDWNYETVSLYFSSLAKQYFDPKRSIHKHTLFFDNVSAFLTEYTSDTQQYELWVGRSKKALAGKILKNGAKIIPNAIFSDENEIIYKKITENTIHIPDFVGINITDFEIKDEHFKKSLKVKDFTDYNEVLKYFSQVSFSGIYSETAISETQQKELLGSLAEIFLNKREKIDSSCHRYSRMFTSLERENNSVANHAYFSISTFFLKTKQGNYKPAQLCKKSDLDLTFFDYPFQPERIDDFLRFLGVSLDNNFIFADSRIYNKLYKGIAYIPKLISNKGEREKLVGDSMIRNIRIISEKIECHPSVINDNNYSFLVNIADPNIKLELDVLLVKQYEKFPKEYVEILFEKLISIPSGTSRLYASLFNQLHKILGKYLVMSKSQLVWAEKNEIFYIARNKDDYEKFIKNNVPVLCYSEKYIIPEKLKFKLITMVEAEIDFVGEKEITNELVENLNNRMVYILSAISSSSQSDLDFKEESSKVTALNEAISSLKIFTVKKLTRKMECNEIELAFENELDALINTSKKTIYFTEACSTRRKTETLTKYFFNNTSIASEVEIILFLKKEEELINDYPKEEIEYFKSIWIKDYKEQFLGFKKDILKCFAIADEDQDEQWNIYDSFHKSKLLIRLYKENKLNDLLIKINKVKEDYGGLFNQFGLNIDYEINDKRICKMLMFLKNKDKVNFSILKENLEYLSKAIGKDEEINALEKQLEDDYGYNSNLEFEKQKTKEVEKQIKLDRIINNILNRLAKDSKLDKSDFISDSIIIQTPIVVNQKKLIFQKNSVSANDSQSLEETGASGEEQVLGYYINQFLLLSNKERSCAINEIYEVIKVKLGNESHLIYKQGCLECFNDDDKLKKTLIPFLYIAIHHKFAYFDIIAYKDGKPIIVEVKTTSSINNDSFYVSVAEVNEAICEPNYEIVRVTPSSIIFMGNPIKDASDKLTSISSSNYKMIPRNYVFKFQNNLNAQPN